MNDKSPSSEDKISTFFKNTDQVTHALQLGIKAALLKHKQAGHSICEWRDGKVVWIPPEQIPVEIKNNPENK